MGFHGQRSGLKGSFDGCHYAVLQRHGWLTGPLSPKFLKAHSDLESVESEAEAGRGPGPTPNILNRFLGSAPGGPGLRALSMVPGSPEEGRAAAWAQGPPSGGRRNGLWGNRVRRGLS